MSDWADVTRAVLVPDPIRVERYSRMPELGPRILFFSGGTALGSICRVLKHYTHNSVHLITPFDSGGSSAELRAAFSMPAVGDLRNRLMALADESTKGNPAIYQLFSYRFSQTAARDALRAELDEMISGEHELVVATPEPLRRLIRTHLKMFAKQMPAEFDLRHASVGNLLLAGGYLANGRDMDSVVFLFSKLIEARGVVRPIVDTDISLYARTADDRIIAGQHAITRREPDDTAALVDLWLGRAPTGEPASCTIEPDIRKLILRADLLCFPVGSLFTSLLANLLPRGVGQAISEARCPKLYIPNTGVDSEQRGIGVHDAVDHIIRLVRNDAGAEVPVSRILNFVLLDTEYGQYQLAPDLDALHRRGVQIIDRSLVDQTRPAQLEPYAVTEVLLSLG